MGNITISSRGGVLKATLPRVRQANLHESLSGERTFACRVPRADVANVSLGDVLTYDGESYDIVRLNVQSAAPKPLADISCEHISYRLNEVTVAAGTYSGTPSQLLAEFLSGTGFSVGTVQVSATVQLGFSSNTNVRAALVGLAALSESEIYYSGTTVSLLTHVGRTVAVELSEKKNVESISVVMDNRSDSLSINVTLFKETALDVGDAVRIDYDSLGVHVSDRVISRDVDPFNPLHLRIVTGDYVPSFVNYTEDGLEEVDEKIEEAEEEILDEVDARIAAAVLDSLYADQGYIAELTVDELSTSRRVRLYILQDTSDDNYIYIKGQYIRFMTGSVTSTTPVQASNRKGELLYWQRQPTGHNAEGFPTDSEGQIPAGTVATAWPVYTYTYTDLVKSEYAFNQENGTYVPMLTLGAGDNNGNSKGYLYKSATELLLQYINSAGNDVSVRLNDDGYVDINKLRRATEMDFSGWDYGYFTEVLDGDISCGYLVDFDSQGRPVTIYDSGHACEVIW